MKKYRGEIIAVELGDKKLYMKKCENNQVSYVLEKERATIFPNAMTSVYFAKNYVKGFDVADLTSEGVYK